MTNQKKLSYEEACVQAATDQGLDPVVARLRAENLPVAVWQTGGFCMIAAVEHPSGPDRYLGITAEGGIDDAYLVCLYDGPDDDAGRIIFDGDADLDTVVDYVSEYLASDGGREQS